MKTKEALDREKQLAARTALRWVKPGMKLGLGSGSTSEWFTRFLAEALRAGELHDVVAVPTSEKVAALAKSLGVPLASLEPDPVLDLAVDGADEIAPGLQLIKGGGGALLREKVVAAAARRNLVFADSSKLVERLGKFPLPLEVAPFALELVKARVKALGGRSQVRMEPASGTPVLTDQRLILLDCHFGDPEKPAIDDPWELQARVESIPGVAGHGLFLETSSAAIVADGETVTLHTRQHVLPSLEVSLLDLPAPLPFPRHVA